MGGAPGNNVISRSGRPEIVAKRPPTWKLPISRTWSGSPPVAGCALTAVVPHIEEAQQSMRPQQAAVTGAPSPRVLLLRSWAERLANPESQSESQERLYAGKEADDHQTF